MTYEQAYILYVVAPGFAVVALLLVVCGVIWWWSNRPPRIRSLGEARRQRWARRKAWRA